jgi:glycosyltransferase involved in cell wall biosynthesis
MKIGYLMQEGVPDIRNRPFSGPANHVVCVIQELKRAGHQVRLLAKLDKQIYFSDDLENFIPVSIGHLEEGLPKLMESLVRRIQYDLKLPFANLFESLHFAQACTQVLPDADVYFERMGWLGYGGGLAAQKLKIPLVLEVNGDHMEEFKRQGLRSQKGQQYLSHFLMKRAALCTSHVVASGEGWRHKYIERWKVAPSKVSIVENGSALVDILRREELRSFKPVTPGDPMRIAYCGGFAVWHGLPILVRAVRRAIDRGCSLQITLIGSGPEEDRIIKLIEELGLESIFMLTGQINLHELAMYLAQAHVGVAPYCGWAEYSGLKLLDYKAAGLATIASGENNQPSVLKDQHTGWIVPPCDEDALTNAIITLAENPQLRIRIGQEARIEAEAIHSWRHTAEQLLDIFNFVRSSKPAARTYV